jgi:hypothetical protein
MEGVGRGHKVLQMSPGAARIPSAERALRSGELPLEVLERYYNKGYLVNPKGERLKPRVIPEGHPTTAKRAMDKGHLPESGKIVFEDPTGAYEPGEYLGFTARSTSDLAGNPMETLMHANQKSGFFGGRPSPYGLTTVGMPEGIGKSAYAMMFDALRAGNHLNSVDILTNINQLRRPGNVMSSGLAHGDYDLLPLFQGGGGDPFPLMPMYGGKRGDAEEEALKSLLGPGNRYDTAINTSARDTLRFSPQAQTGLLALREAQLARAHGPEGLANESIYNLANPMDLDALKHYATRARQEGTQPYSTMGPARAFGPGFLGRAGSTEAFMGGIERGLEPEDIARKLLELPGASDAIKGRYRKGGLVAALES